MSNRNSILLLDPSFDPVSATSCNLLINIGLDSISYAIIDNNNCRIYTVFNEQECEDPLKNIADRLKTDPYLKLTFASVKISVHTESKILIPNELYDQSDLATQAQFLPGIHSNNIYVYQLENFSLTTIFALPKPTESLLQAHFPEAELLTGLIPKQETKGSALTINFSAGSFSLVYIKDEKLVFEQVYEISATEEFNYYLLLIINQLNIAVDSSQVYLSGIVHEGDERYLCLTKYFSHVYFLTLDEKLRQEILEDLPAHYYVNLLSIHSCE